MRVLPTLLLAGCLGSGVAPQPSPANAATLPDLATAPLCTSALDCPIPDGGGRQGLCCAGSCCDNLVSGKCCGTCETQCAVDQVCRDVRCQ